MIKTPPSSLNQHSQQGSTLLITLIFMLLLSIIALSMARTATANLNVSGMNIDRQRSFMMAEDALKAGKDALAAIKIEHGCDDSDSDCFVSKFKDNCTDGFCFNGTYEVTAAVPPATSDTVSCKISDEDLSQNKNSWDNAFEADGYKYLVEFRCFVAAIGAPTPPAAAARGTAPTYDMSDLNRWNASFLVSAMHQSDDGSRVMLQQSYIAEQTVINKGVPGVFSVNKTLNMSNQARVDSYYCPSCSKEELDNNTSQVLFNPKEVAGVAYGKEIIYTEDVGGVATVINTPEQTIGGMSGTDGGEEFYDESKHVGEKAPDDYFAQYFDKNRATVVDEAEEMTQEDFYNLDVTSVNKDSPKTIVIKGDLNLQIPASGNLTHHSEHLTIIVQGDLTIGSAYTNTFGMIYVEKDFHMTDTAFISGLIAIEGNATLSAGLTLRPKIDPVGTGGKGIPSDPTWASNSWHEVEINF